MVINKEEVWIMISLSIYITPFSDNNTGEIKKMSN